MPLCKMTRDFFCAGGRFKKEVIIDGYSHLLLIRDEGGLPEMQVWTDKKI